MSIKYGERIVLFGAGDFGHQAARLLRFEKDILYIVDNDLSIFGGQIEGAVIEAHESLDTFEELNFLTKNDVLSELQKYANLKIQDRDELFPDVQRKDGKLINHRRIDFVIRKL